MKLCKSACFASSGQLFVLQLAVWGLRGVTGVILANNPLSGVLILASVCWTSPWQALLGTLGVLISTLAAVVMGQDRYNYVNLPHSCQDCHDRYQVLFNSNLFTDTCKLLNCKRDYLNIHQLSMTRLCSRLLLHLSPTYFCNFQFHHN